LIRDLITYKMKYLLSLFLIFFAINYLSGQKNTLNEKIIQSANEEIETFRGIYIGLHKNPELSLMEVNTSGKLAKELKKLGFEVTTGIGGNGVVGIYKNGQGKTLMLRTDMDALPILENTGLPYASTVVMKDVKGKENPVMHACGHDIHMTTWLGTLSTLVALKKEWKGTIMAVAQPAEEGMTGAFNMLNDGLFKRFPVPDLALCYHVNAELPAGTIGYFPGPIFAGVETADITVYGYGGHGAMPHKTVDPIVISARIILDIQTIVSREINPLKPAVITVGSIHGGTRANVIPEEVKMLLTIRFFDIDVLNVIKKSLIDITRGAAISAGLPENKMPLVVFDPDVDAPVTNNPALVMESVKSMKVILGDKNVIQVDPSMVAEDFGKYGITGDSVPVALFWLGGVNNAKYNESIVKGTKLPPLHNSSFAPDFDPAFKTGVAAMTRTMIDLFGKKK
jgi:amidohydrolase